MATGVKEIRCGARRSETTCKATGGVCDWDSVAQVCKKNVVPRTPTKVKTKVVVKKSSGCNVKTRVACVKRDHCLWDSKIKMCSDKPNNQKQNNQGNQKNNNKQQNNKEPKDPKDNKNHAQNRGPSQGDIIMKGVHDAIAVVHAKSTDDARKMQIKVSINGGNAFNTFDTNATTTRTPARYTSTSCRIAKVAIQGLNNFETRLYEQDFREITTNVNTQLATINRFTEVIEVKPLTLAEINVITKAFLRTLLIGKDKIRCYIRVSDTKEKKKENKKDTKKTRKDDGNDALMGFFAYDGCYDPDVTENTILGHTIYNIPKCLPGFPEYLSKMKMKLYTSTGCNILQHEYRPKYDAVSMYTLDGNSEALNVSMMMYMQEAEALDKMIVQRILTLLKEFQKIQDSSNLYSKPFVVFHGTTQAIHHTNRFVTSTFLSTSTSFSTAYSYSGSSSGTVYVIEVPPNFPFINYCSRLSQILLPPWTSIVIEKSVFIKSTRYVLCKADVNVDFKSFIQIFENPCTHTETIHMDRADSPLLSGQLYDCYTAYKTGSSSFYSCKGPSGLYVVKDIVKKNNRAQLLSNDHHVFIRILNELLASVIYREVYGLSTFDLQLVDKRNAASAIGTMSSFLIASKSVDGIRYYGFKAHDRKLLLNGFFVDCILGNWDVFNNLNIGFNGDGVIRTDVGGCMAFRGKGDYNISYDMNVAPRDHIALLQQRSVKELKTTPDIIRESLKYLESITDVEDRLKRVRETFAHLVNSLASQAHRIKYMKFVDKLIKVVLYRDNWYRINGSTAINAMFNIGKVTDNAEFNAYIQNAEVVSQSPVAFVMSPGKLKITLEKLKMCKR